MNPTELTRTANFSNSSIWKLMKKATDKKNFGAHALTYIEEKRMEKRLGRALANSIDSKPTNWGTLVERLAFESIGIEYKLESRTRYSHPTIKNWNCMPDTLKPDTVSDIKCPYTLKSFCTKVDAHSSLIEFKKENPEDYWQLVGNSIICDKKFAESIVYVPYKKDISDIRLMASEGMKGKFIEYMEDDELPWLPEGGYYKNLNIFKFEVPQYDKDELTECVIRAVEMLNA